MKSVFMSTNTSPQAQTFAHPRAKPNLKQGKRFETIQV
jgi:hypothetical protein